MTTIASVREAFSILFSTLSQRGYCDWTEQQLLPLSYTYLVGFFGLEKVIAEVSVLRPTSQTGIGRVDFMIDDIAVEFAVRANYQSAQNLNAITNSTEVEKLIKYSGLSLLVLFDFSEQALTDNKLEEFRNLPSLGKGNHKKYPFNLSYFHRDTEIHKNIRT